MIIEKLRATYEREIERKPMNNIIFYGGFAVLVFLGVFLLGIRPAAVTLAQNNRYKKELEEIRGRMETKLAQIQTGETQLSKVTAGVAELNKALPDDVLLQDFLQELVVESAKSGFAIQRVKQSDPEGDEIPVDVDMIGEVSNLPSLLDSIENMKRFVNIVDARFDVDGSTANLKLRLKIYKI